MSGKINKIFKEELENILKEQEKPDSEDQNYDDGCDGSLDDDCDYQSGGQDALMQRTSADQGDQDAYEQPTPGITAAQLAAREAEAEKRREEEAAAAEAVEKFKTMMQNIRRPSLDELKWSEESIVRIFFSVAPDKDGNLSYFADRDTIQKIETAIKDARCISCRQRRYQTMPSGLGFGPVDMGPKFVKKPAWYILRDLVTQMKKQFPQMEDKHFLTNKGLRIVAEEMWPDMMIDHKTTWKDFPKDKPLDPLSVLALDDRSYNANYEKIKAREKQRSHDPSSAARARSALGGSRPPAGVTGRPFGSVGGIQRESHEEKHLKEQNNTFNRGQMATPRAGGSSGAYKESKGDKKSPKTLVEWRGHHRNAKTDGKPIGVNSLPDGITLKKYLRLYERKIVSNWTNTKIKNSILWQAKVNFQTKKDEADLYNAWAMGFFVVTFLIPGGIALGSAVGGSLLRLAAARAGSSAAQRAILPKAAGATFGGAAYRFTQGLTILAAEMLVLEAAFGWRGYKQIKDFFTTRKQSIAEHIANLKAILENIIKTEEITAAEIRQLKHSLEEIKRNALQLKNAMVRYVGQVDFNIGNKGPSKRKGSQQAEVNMLLDAMVSQMVSDAGGEEFQDIDDSEVLKIKGKFAKRFAEEFNMYIDFYFEIHKSSAGLGGSPYEKDSDFSRTLPKQNFSVTRGGDQDSVKYQRTSPSSAPVSAPSRGGQSGLVKESRIVKEYGGKETQDLIQKSGHSNAYSAAAQFRSMEKSKATSKAEQQEKVKNTVEEILQNITKPKDLTWTHEVVFRNFLSIGPTKDKSLGISIAKEALNNIEKVRESSWRAVEQLSTGQVSVSIDMSKKSTGQEIRNRAGRVIPQAELLQRHMFQMQAGLKKAFPNLTERDFFKPKQFNQVFKALKHQVTSGSRDWRDIDPISVLSLRGPSGIPGRVNIGSKNLSQLIKETHKEIGSKTISFSRDSLLWVAKQMWEEKKAKEDLYFWISMSLLVLTLVVPWTIGVVRGLQALRAGQVAANVARAEIAIIALGDSMLYAMAEMVILELIFGGPMVKELYHMANTRTNQINNHITTIESILEKIDKTNIISDLELKQIETTMEDLSRISKEHMSGILGLVSRTDFDISKSYDMAKSRIKNSLAGVKSKLESSGLGEIEIIPGDDEDYKSIQVNPRRKQFISHLRNLLQFYRKFLEQSNPGGTARFSKVMPKSVFKQAKYNRKKAHSVKESVMLENKVATSLKDIKTEFVKVVANQPNPRIENFWSLVGILNSYQSNSPNSSATSKAENDGDSILSGIRNAHVQVINSNPTADGNWLGDLPANIRLTRPMRGVVMFANPRGGAVSPKWFSLYANHFLDSSKYDVGTTINISYCANRDGSSKLPVVFSSLYNSTDIVKKTIKRFHYFSFLVDDYTSGGRNINIREKTPGWPDDVQFEEKGLLKQLLISVNKLPLDNLWNLADQINPNNENSLFVHSGDFESRDDAYKKEARRLYRNLVGAIENFRKVVIALNKKIPAFLNSPSEKTFSSLLPELFILHSIQREVGGIL